MSSCDQRNESETKRLAYAVLAFLDEEFRKPTTTSDSRESLEVAMQCLETAFGITLRDTCLKPDKTLREVYQSRPAPQANQGGVGNGQFNIPQSFANLMSGAQASPAAAPGSVQPVEIKLGSKYLAPPQVSAEVKARADGCKDAGNNLMKDGAFADALKVYTEAIDLDGNNAVYFCNRSASYIKLDDLDKALQDVQIAIQLDPAYARAYGRMGVIHSNLGNHHDAYSCYKKANELDPSNESYANNLRVSTAIVNQEPTQDSGSEQFPGPNQFAALFQNPALMSMATQMLQDPAMQNMMRSFMTTMQPNANLGGNVAGGNPGMNFGGNPGLEQILQMGQAIASQLSNSFQPDGSGRRPGGDNNDQDPPPNDTYDL